jgi:hypothetical protein
MHTHICQYCDRDFVCRSALDCYDKGSNVTCRDCYWTRELRPFVTAALIIGTIASLVVYFLFYGGTK